MHWEFDGLPMPMAPLVYVDVLQVLDLMPISVTCYIVSRDQPCRCSTVYLVLGKTLRTPPLKNCRYSERISKRRSFDGGAAPSQGDGGDQSGIQVMGYFPGESVPLLCVLNVKKSATVAIVWSLKWRLYSALFLLNY